jgi:hypothetical protein
MSDVRKTLEIFTYGEPFEITAIGNEQSEKAITTGFFDDIGEAIQAVENGLGQWHGIFYCTNPIPPEFLNVTRNKMKKGISRPTDAQIPMLRQLLIDLDPKKTVSGISSTAQEKERTMIKAHEIKSFLMGMGEFPDLIIADSANGYHIPLIIEPTPNEAANVQILRKFLELLNEEFADEFVEIDLKTYNPSRLSKLYGTWVRKGENTQNRPHRRSQILHIPSEIIPVSFEVIRNSVPQGTVQRAFGPDSGQIDVTVILDKYNVPYEKQESTSKGDRNVYILTDGCPWKDQHTTANGERDASVMQNINTGVITFHCWHSHCALRKWDDFKAHYGIICGQQSDKITIPPQ